MGKCAKNFFCFSQGINASACISSTEARINVQGIKTVGKNSENDHLLHTESNRLDPWINAKTNDFHVSSNPTTQQKEALKRML